MKTLALKLEADQHKTDLIQPTWSPCTELGGIIRARTLQSNSHAAMLTTNPDQRIFANLMAGEFFRIYVVIHTFLLLGAHFRAITSRVFTMSARAFVQIQDKYE